MLRRCSRSLFRTALAFGVAASLVAPSDLSAQALRAFTVDDALRVRSASVSAVTDDARWIAATIRTGRSGLDRDHLRHGDPTYITPSRVEVVVIDAGG